MKAYEKALGVRAFQWNGHSTAAASRFLGVPSPPQHAEPYATGDGAYLGVHPMGHSALVVPVNGTEFRVEIGQWILADPDGWIVLGDDVFQLAYELSSREL